MATAANQTQKTLYFAAAIGIAAIMFTGFARNYYLRAWIGTRAITAMVHVHGLIMTAWVVLFMTQTLLVAKHRVDLHRKLGVFGAGLAAVVFGLGVFTIVRSIERHRPHAGSRLLIELFVAFDGVSLLLFACLVVTALMNRRRREIHKRLMLIAMISLLPPAFGRLVAYFTLQNVELIVLALMYASVLTCLIADGWRNRRVHPAFAIGGLSIIAANQLTYFAQTHAA
jgi:Ca2+/Na+ antiporter